MAKLIKFLVVVQRLKHPGGVTTFYRNLKHCLPVGRVDYFELISSRDNYPLYVFPFFFIGNYLQFTLSLIRDKHAVVFLNPSMSSLALIRDGLFLLISKCFKKKVVVFYHGWNEKYVKHLEKKGLSLFKFVFFRSNAFVVLSTEFEEKIRTWGYQSQIRCLTTHVPDKLLKIGMNRFYEIENASSEFNILFLSRIERNKGIEEALIAFNNIRKKYPQVSMICAGSGPELEFWKEYADKEKIPALFPGHLEGDAKIEVFKNAHCYILPSYSEGMPTTVLEAMAFGVPIIVHATGGLKYMFEHEKMGFITDSLDPEVYASFIERLVVNRESIKMIGMYNCKYIDGNCTSSVVAEKIMDLLNEVNTSSS